MAEAPKFTPGPWEVKGTSIQGGNMHLASVTDERDIPVDPVEAIANARLMAAAPQLYEALTYCVRLLEDMGHGGLAGAILAKNVIAKVERR